MKQLCQRKTNKQKNPTNSSQLFPQKYGHLGRKWLEVRLGPRMPSVEHWVYTWENIVLNKQKDQLLLYNYRK